MTEEREPAITEMIALVQQADEHMKVIIDKKQKRIQRSKTRRARLRRAVRKILK